VSLDVRADCANEFSDGVDDVKKQKNKALLIAMVNADMTQTKLAEVTEMHLTNINAIVNGTRPKLDTALKIAKVLNTTVEALWGQEEDE
jgi:DNA-binding XRE family transcriptional regulator